MEKKNNRLIKRLHVSLPAVLFDSIVKNGDLDRVDDLVSELLSQHYGVDLNARLSSN
jgi:hypothetical protein